MSELRVITRQVPGTDAAVGDIVDVSEWRNARTLEALRYLGPVPEGAVPTPRRPRRVVTKED